MRGALGRIAFPCFIRSVPLATVEPDVGRARIRSGEKRLLIAVLLRFVIRRTSTINTRYAMVVTPKTWF